VSESPIVYSAHPDVTPETEAAALAAVYKFLLDTHGGKKAFKTSRGKKGTENHTYQERRPHELTEIHSRDVKYLATEQTERKKT
jgi:hypothetical protein